MRRLVGIAAVISLAAFATTLQARQDTASPLHRVVPDNLRIPEAPHPCTVAITVANLARRMQFLSGVEYPLADCSRWVPESFPQFVSINGVTVEQLLDMLVEQNPEYRWTVLDEVVVARPVASWRDQRHFLNAPLGALDLDDVHLGGAMAGILERLLHDTTRGASMRERSFSVEPANHRFSIHLGSATVLEGLNAAIAAHGSMSWGAHPHTPATGDEAPSLSFTTFDGFTLSATTKKYR